MSAVVDGPGAVAEVFFPGADGDNAAAPVMVTGTEKGIEIVLATVAWGVLQSVAENPPPLFQMLIGEMQFLAVTRFWPVNPVEQSRDARNQSQPGQGNEISRSVQ